MSVISILWPCQLGEIQNGTQSTGCPGIGCSCCVPEFAFAPLAPTSSNNERSDRFRNHRGRRPPADSRTPASTYRFYPQAAQPAAITLRVFRGGPGTQICYPCALPKVWRPTAVRCTCHATQPVVLGAPRLLKDSLAPTSSTGPRKLRQAASALAASFHKLHQLSQTPLGPTSSLNSHTLH